MKRLRPALAILAVLAAIALLWSGLFSHHLFAQEIWTPRGTKRFVNLLWRYWAIFGVLWLLRPSLIRPLFVAGLILCAGIAVGPAAVLAPLLFVLSAWCIGLLVLPENPRGEAPLDASDLVRVLAGVSVIAWMMTWMARLPVHYPAVYLALLVVPIAACGKRLRRLRPLMDYFSPLQATSRLESLGVGLLGFVILCQFLVVLSPETGADALQVHLAVAADIAIHHRYTFDAARVATAVMPMGADWCYAITYTLGGEHGARLLNFVMMLLLAGIVVALVRKAAPALRLEYLFAALVVSCPLEELVTGNLMTDNMWGALLLAAVLATALLWETRNPLWLRAFALTLGGALLVKLGAILLVVAVIPFVIYALRRGGWQPKLWKNAVAAIAILLAVGGSPYLIAWWLTGNPVFPFANQIFRSPLFDTTGKFYDARWKAPFKFRTLYDWTFDTQRFLESQNGGIGFAFLFLFPITLFTVSRRWRFAVWMCLASGIIFVLCIIHPLHYLRYVYPGLLLVLAASAAGLEELRSWSRTLFGIVVAACFILVGLNIYFLPSSNWSAKDFYINVFKANARRNYFLQTGWLATRVLIDRLNQVAPGQSLFLEVGPGGAGAIGDVYTPNWYSERFYEDLRAAQTPDEVRTVMAKWNIHYFIFPTNEGFKNYKQPALDEFLAQCSFRIEQAGYFELAQERTCQVSATDGRRSP